MEQETKIIDKKCCWKMNKGNTSGGFLYCLGFIGAAVYYIQHADTLKVGVIGILKAIIWPAMLVHKALELLKF